jgi:hydrogenase expression/formation protein HypE
VSTKLELDCPVPAGSYERIVLAHGAGGRLSERLVDEVFRRAFGGPELAQGHDGASLVFEGQTAITTDGFTVRPLFFPGGDIGSLAIHGTVNDLVSCGAEPTHFTASFILEEGMRIGELERIAKSMGAAAREAGLVLAAGDTKVVERGKGDGVYITVTGLGRVRTREPLSPSRISPGDRILLSGPVGDHGLAVVLAREALSFEAVIESDSASTWPLLAALLESGVEPHCARDATRGGLATVLVELAEQASVDLRVSERAIPVRPTVADACELLGLDPLYVACEGRLVFVVPEAQAELALATLRAAPGGAEACLIGEASRATAGHSGRGRALLDSGVGGARVLDRLAGEPIPRIC